MGECGRWNGSERRRRRRAPLMGDRNRYGIEPEERRGGRHERNFRRARVLWPRSSAQTEGENRRGRGTSVTINWR